MHLLTRTLLFILSATVFYYVLTEITPPNSWPEASTVQILSFFIPLLCSITFFINILLNKILKSTVVGLGLMFALVLLAARLLTPLSAALTFFVTGILFTYTPHFRHLRTHGLKRLGHHKKEHQTEKHLKPPKLIKRL